MTFWHNSDISADSSPSLSGTRLKMLVGLWVRWWDALGVWMAMGGVHGGTSGLGGVFSAGMMACILQLGGSRVKAERGGALWRAQHGSECRAHGSEADAWQPAHPCRSTTVKHWGGA